MKFFLFFSIIDILLTVLTYAYLRKVFSWCRGWKFLIVYLLLSINIVACRLLSESLPLCILHWSAYIGGLWLGIIYYIFLVALLHTVLYIIFHYIFKIRLPHKKVAGVLGLIFGGLIIYGLWAAGHPVVRYEKIFTDKLTQENRIRLGMVCDVHLGRILKQEHAQKTVALLNGEKPQMVLICGDMVDEKISYVLRTNSLAEFGKLQAPLGVYLVFGNHDYLDDAEKLQKLLAEQGIKVLQDENIFLDDVKIKITGLKDFSRSFGSGNLPFLAMNNEKFYSILLDHQPRRFLEAQKAGYDVYLAGHTHTGQIFPNRFITKSLFVLDYGRKEFGKMTGIVSCGIGFWGVPLRSLIRPEIVIIDVYGNGRKS